MIDKELLKAINQINIKYEEISLDGLNETLDLLESAQNKLRNIFIKTRVKKLMQDFDERETDVYVVTFPRSGTTLMQMMVYQLTTDGNMDFNHLYEVSPWFGFYAAINRPLPENGNRRIIKSHDEYSMFKDIRKGKFIFVIRDCLDVIPSFHELQKNYNNPNENFDDHCIQRMKDWLFYNNEWIINEHGLEIIYINYEDLIENKRDAIIKISSFLDIKIDNKTISRVLERTSFNFMKRYESKFGEQPSHYKVFNNFIRKGTVGEGKAKFTKEQLHQYKTLFSIHGVGNPSIQRYNK